MPGNRISLKARFTPGSRYASGSQPDVPYTFSLIRVGRGGCRIVRAVAALIAALASLLAQTKRPAHTPVAGIRPIHVIYGPGVGTQPFFDNPMGAAFGNDGRVYVADTGNNRVVVFDRDGRYLFQFGRLGVAKPAKDGVLSWAPGLFNYPTDVATDGDGNVYVADFNNDQIQVFDPEGKFVRVFPDRGKRVGKGASGSGGNGVAVSSLSVQGDRVYVTDRYQVLEFTTDGTFLTQFGKPGTGPGDLDHPNGIAVGNDGTVYVSDSNHARVIAYDAAGAVKWTAGDIPNSKTETSTGGFQLPRGIARQRPDLLQIFHRAAVQVGRVREPQAHTNAGGHLTKQRDRSEHCLPI